jgi:hypothetical protein
MKLTKQDLMHLPKERLAELLVEMQEVSITTPEPNPSIPTMPAPPSGWGCDGTTCYNPLMDCINCPRRFKPSTITTTDNTKELK